MTNKTIFVTGSTGNQGGYVAKHLASAGFHVKALSRNPSSTKAQSLQQLNIEVVKGDLDDASTYREYLKDVYGVFSVQTFENGVDKEIKQGNTLATIAKEAGVKHFVYTSAVAADIIIGVPHINSKLQIENHIKKIGLPFTIIRPSSFFENFLIPQVSKGILKGKLVQPINKNTVLQHIAAEDIGRAVVKVFQHSEVYFKRTITLASEQLTAQEVADKFSSVLKKEIRLQRLPTIITRLFLGKTLYKMFKWMDENNSFRKEDLESTHKEFPNLLSLEEWIKIHFQPK